MPNYLIHPRYIYTIVKKDTREFFSVKSNWFFVAVMSFGFMMVTFPTLPEKLIGLFDFSSAKTTTTSQPSDTWERAIYYCCTKDDFIVNALGTEVNGHFILYTDREQMKTDVVAKSHNGPLRPVIAFVLPTVNDHEQKVTGEIYYTSSMGDYSYCKYVANVLYIARLKSLAGQPFNADTRAQYSIVNLDQKSWVSIIANNLNDITTKEAAIISFAVFLIFSIFFGKSVITQSMNKEKSQDGLRFLLLSNATIVDIMIAKIGFSVLYSIFFIFTFYRLSLVFLSNLILFTFGLVVCILLTNCIDFLLNLFSNDLSSLKVSKNSLYFFYVPAMMIFIPLDKILKGSGLEGIGGFFALIKYFTPFYYFCDLIRMSLTLFSFDLTSFFIDCLMTILTFGAIIYFLRQGTRWGDFRKID